MFIWWIRLRVLGILSSFGFSWVCNIFLHNEVCSSNGLQLADSKSRVDEKRDSLVTTLGLSATTDNAESSSSTPKFSAELKVASRLRKFTFNELKLATRNFRPESLLGEGGFGCVFKGWIEENGTAPAKPGTGLTVAVKTLNHDGLQGHKEWMV